MEKEILQNITRQLEQHFSKLSKHTMPDNVVKELDRIFNPDLNGLDAVSQKEIRNLLKMEKDIARLAVIESFDNDPRVRENAKTTHKNQMERFERHADLLQEPTVKHPEIHTLKDAYQTIVNELKSGKANPLTGLDHRKFPKLSENDRESILSEKELQLRAFYQTGNAVEGKIEIELGRNNKIKKFSHQEETIKPAPKTADGQIDIEGWNKRVIDRLEQKISELENNHEKFKSALDHSIKSAFVDMSFKGNLKSGANVSPSHSQNPVDNSQIVKS